MTRRTFSDLASMRRFLRGSTDYDHENLNTHRLRTGISYMFGSNVSVIQFLGTQHSFRSIWTGEPSDAEKESIDCFVEGIGPGDLVLVETGESESGEVENNYLERFRKSSESDLPEYVSKSGIQLFGEMGYAANLCLVKGARVRNMDLNWNPAGLPRLVERYGLDKAISSLKSASEGAIPQDGPRDHFVQRLLSEQGYDVGEDCVKSIPQPTFDEPKIPNDEDRDNFMTDQVIGAMPENERLYVIAHTAHIAEIMKRLDSRGRIIPPTLHIVSTHAPDKEANMMRLESGAY